MAIEPTSLPRYDPNWVDPNAMELKLPQYKKPGVFIVGKTGDTFKGRKGSYTIQSIKPETLIVTYKDGPWAGKTIEMSKTTHNKMQLMIPIQDKVLTEDKLNLWWDKYPAIYTEEWKEGMKGSELLSILELKYPNQSESINNHLVNLQGPK